MPAIFRSPSFRSKPLIKATCFVLMCFAALLPITAASADIDGVVNVKLEHAERTEYRAGLVVGDLPEPLSGSVVLLPRDALYSPDLELVSSIGTVRRRGGQVLDVPTVEISSSRPGLRTLSMVAVEWAPPAGVAACLGSVIPGRAIQVVTAPSQGNGALLPITGRIAQWRNNTNLIELDVAGSSVQAGDPVLIQAEKEPNWRVLGLVREFLPPNRAQVLTLREIFDGLPSETGTWGIQPLGLCDPSERFPEPGWSRKLEDLAILPAAAMTLAGFAAKDPEKRLEFEGLEFEEIRDGLLDMDAPELAEMWPEFLDDPSIVMRRSWPAIRSYLNRPEIEHYLFSSRLNDQQQSAQMWLSLLARAETEKGIQVQSPLAAAGPVARLRSRLPEGGSERGWAVAVAYTEGAILLLTANHLVKPGQGGDRDILVYLPSLQGYGLEARRLPFVDEKLDLGVIAVQASAKLREKVFSVYQVACPESLAGAVEVPVNAWGWRRERLRGVIKPDPGSGTLRISGVDVTRGFSGGAVLKYGNQIAGILTKSLGREGGSLAAPIHAGLRLVTIGNPGFLSAACEPSSIEDQIKHKVSDALYGRKPIPTPRHQELTKLFTDNDARQIHARKLPDMRSYYFEESDDKLDSLGDAALEVARLSFMAQAEMRCVAVTGQDTEPTSQAFLDRTAPRGPDGRPTIRREDTVGCDLPRSGTKRPAFREDLNIPLCGVFGYTSNEGFGWTMMINNRLWDATFIMKCRKVEAEWYTPPGWVRKMAVKTPAVSELRRIPAGSFQMGGCSEDDLSQRSRESWFMFARCGRYGKKTEIFEASTPAFRIQRFPVTVAEYARCVRDGRCSYTTPDPDLHHVRKSPCSWGRAENPRYPMNCITWTDAAEYCQAVGGQLPTEKQWEKAARGIDARPVPWGQEDEVRYSMQDYLIGKIMEVGLAPELASPYGVEDIAWHIKEWTTDHYEPYTPGWTGESLLGEHHSRHRVLRGVGGSTFYREASPVDNAREHIGFRCVFAN